MATRHLGTSRETCRKVTKYLSNRPSVDKNNNENYDALHVKRGPKGKYETFTLASEQL